MCIGEIPNAYVKLVSNYTVDELKRYCIKMLADYKIPRQFFVVGKIEKTLTGKVNRRKNYGCKE